jgi:hypothetical protein
MRFQLQTGLFLLIVASATIAEAQVAPVPQQFPQRMHRPRTALPESSPAPGVQPTPPIAPQQAAVAPLTASQPAAPPPVAPLTASSLLDQPAKPAQVHVDDGELSVKADNSTLSGILHDISSQTGMTVDGLSRDQRVFGNYGPATPREILSALLDGMGYNVMMVGVLDNGAPRQLVLTLRTSGAAAAPGPGSNGGRQMPGIRQNAGDDDDDSTPDQQDAQPPRPEPNPPEPAPQPEQTPPAGQPGQIKTPQQMLQELQQIRQQQLQQQQANPQ